MERDVNKFYVIPNFASLRVSPNYKEKWQLILCEFIYKKNISLKFHKIDCKVLNYKINIILFYFDLNKQI